MPTRDTIHLQLSIAFTVMLMVASIASADNRAFQTVHATATPAALSTTSLTPLSVVEYMLEGIARFKSLVATAFYESGKASFNQGEYDQAIKYTSQAIALDPNYGFAYYLRGAAYRELNDLDRALDDFSRVIVLAPFLSEAYLNRGYIYYQIRDYDRALADYSQALKLDPTYTPTYIERGNTNFVLGNLEEAFADYSQAIILDPTNAQAYLSRGAILFLLVERGLSQQPEVDLRQALADWQKVEDLGFELSETVMEAIDDIHARLGDES